MTLQRNLAADTVRHPFLSRKGCKSDPRGHPLDIPLMGLAAFPAVWAAPTGAGHRAHGLAKTTAAGYANRSLSAPIRDTLQRQLAPGCSKKSSAAAETAHTPAEGMTRPRVLFAALPRLTRFCYPLRHSAIWPRRLAAPSGGHDAPWVLSMTLPRHTQICLERCHSAAWERALPASAVSPTGRWPLPGQDDAP